MEEDFCIGPLKSNNKKWYIPIGKNPDQCTYCEYCKNNNLFDVNQTYEWKGSPLINCNCDGNGYEKYTLNVDNICVSIWDVDLKKPFNKISEEHLSSYKLQEAENHNILLIDLPTNTKYKIRIIRCGNKIKYFTIENGKIGTTKIKGLNRCLPINNQNDNLRIYNAVERIVKGVNVGDNGFTFISDDSNRNDLVLETDKANKLTFTIQQWEREPRSVYNFQNNPFRNIVQAGQESLSDIVNTNNIPVNLGSSNVIGSMTGTSNNNLGDVFIKVGQPIDITIQLVCTQNNDVKIQRNVSYYENRVKMEKRRLLHDIKKINDNIHKINTKIVELTQIIDNRKYKLDEKIEEYEKLSNEKYTDDSIEL